MHGSTRAGGKEAICEPCEGAVLMFQTERLFRRLPFSAASFTDS